MEVPDLVPHMASRSLLRQHGSPLGGNISYSVKVLVDLTTLRDDGQRWDLSAAEHRLELEQLQSREGQDLLLGSPSSAVYNSLAALSQTAEQRQHLQEERQAHLKAYRRQGAQGEGLFPVSRILAK
eukprot:757022-Amphidinium_carterae.1